MLSKRGRKPKYFHTIILNINAREIYKKYKTFKTENTPSIIEYTSKNNNDGVTTLKKSNCINYEASSNKNHITMIDYVKYGCLPERTDLWCSHCKHPFNTSPIGIPINYVDKKKDKIQLDKDKVTGVNDYFLTYHIVCSWSCGLAFINDNSHKSIYKNSKSLFYSLYYKIYNKELKAEPAPSWECLDVHGGNLSIKEFRKSFCNFTFIITENIKRPYMVAVGKYVEEKRCGYL